MSIKKENLDNLRKMSKHGSKFPRNALILTIIALLILTGLGLWQLQRLQWKQELLAGLARAYEIADTVALSASQIEKTKTFIYGNIVGHYATDQSLLLGLRTRAGTPGYHLLSVFVPASSPGAPLLVNRGWVPLDYEIENGAAPSGRQRITGLIRPAEAPSRWAPANDPAAGQWHRLDLEQIAAHFDYNELLPVIVYEAPRADKESAAYPAGFMMDDWQIPNNHLQYALTWFGLALTLAVIFYLRFFRQ